MDNKNMKSTKKIGGGGFMCHSQTSTAVCMSMTTLSDQKSVIAPKRLDRTTLMMNNNLGKYSRMQLIDASPPNYPHALIKRIAAKPPHYHKPATINPAFDHVFQVVVMRVSLHCQGCAGKVKKHLSKMEGVTSFSIDLESKRVTVMGHVSPVGVLESISKVKRAELWTC